MGLRASVPDAVAAALATLMGQSVAHVRVIEHAWLMRLHGRAIATTRRRRIYLRGSAADFFASPWLMLHEYYHVARQWEPGVLTRRAYLLESLRRGYWHNRFEVEARHFADTHTAALTALLRASGCPIASSAPRRPPSRAPGSDPRASADLRS
jgi:hypothetical protein